MALAPPKPPKSAGRLSVAKSSAPIPHGIRKSSKSVWRSFPVASRLSASALLPKLKSTSASCASKMPSTLRAAVEEGVIAGGGSALVQIAKGLDEFANEFDNE